MVQEGKSMVVRKLFSQTGNALFMVTLAMAALAGGTYVIMKQTTEARKSVRSVSQKKATEVIERKLKAYLIDRSYCNENFSGQGFDIGQNRELPSLTKNGRPFLEAQKTYQNGSIRALSFQMVPKTANSFDLRFEYEKTNAQLGGKTIIKNFNVSAQTNSSNEIIDCYMNDDGEVTDAFDEAMNKICNGPGVISTAERCTVMEFDLQSFCGGNEAVKGFSYNSATEKLNFVCEKIITQIGTDGAQCPFGLKATSEPGKFECFQLSDLVDTSSVTVEENSNCGIGVDSATGKIKLSCSAGAPSIVTCGAPPQDPATVCAGITQSYNDSSGSPTCSFTGTKDCSASGTVYACNSGIWKPSPPLNPQSCSIISPACSDSSGLGFMSGATICCESIPTANCANSSEPTPPDSGDSGMTGCFLAGTEVSLFNGKRKPIEDVSLDDVLLGTSGGPVKVVALMSYENKGPKYSINGGRYFVTGSHPFKTVEGWKAFSPELAKIDNPALEVGRLKIGDAVYTENGIEVVHTIDKKESSEKVYNFQVDGVHEYIANGFQVHNKSECSCIGMSGGSGNNCSQSPPQYVVEQGCVSGGGTHTREVCGPCGGL